MTDAQHPWLTRFVDWLARHRAGLVFVALALTLASIKPANRLKLDERIESFYAEGDPDDPDDPGDPDLKAWLDSKGWFGGDEFVILREDDVLAIVSSKK